MAKCDLFANYHCCCDDCPNIQCDMFEERYELPWSDILLERIDCDACQYNDLSDCDDCLFQGTLDCPEERVKHG